MFHGCPNTPDAPSESWSLRKHRYHLMPLDQLVSTDIKHPGTEKHDTDQGRRRFFKADGTPSRRLVLMIRLRNFILLMFVLAIIALFAVGLPLGLWAWVDHQTCGTTGISQCTLPCAVNPDADIVGIGVRAFMRLQVPTSAES